MFAREGGGHRVRAWGWACTVDEERLPERSGGRWPHRFDTNGNGTIDKDELAGLIKALDLESLLGEAEGELDEGRTWEEGELAILSAGVSLPCHTCFMLLSAIVLVP